MLNKFVEDHGVVMTNVIIMIAGIVLIELVVAIPLSLLLLWVK